MLELLEPHGQELTKSLPYPHLPQKARSAVGLCLPECMRTEDLNLCRLVNLGAHTPAPPNVSMYSQVECVQKTCGHV